MNRRNFLGTLLAAGAGFSVLPGARLYTRTWRRLPSMGYELYPASELRYRAVDYYGEWHWYEWDHRYYQVLMRKDKP